MKKTIIISLLIGFAASAMAAKETVEAPLQNEFADKLVSVFGGDDNILSERELVRVVDFLQTNLPEKTYPTNMTTWLSRQNNARNAPRGDMTEERLAIREDTPENITRELIAKYDSDKDNYVTKSELANALTNIIGVPGSKAGFNQGTFARK